MTEFVESWDKELYELNNLDFFIFLMINHLGNQLDKQFFVEHRQHSHLFLNFEHLGTICFNIGDSFEYFLEENCLGSCPINCLRDLDGQVDIIEGKIEEKIKHKLELLQSFMVGKLDKEQCLRIDLMNQVILDSLLQFYSEEFDIEFEENDLTLLELSEFIENVIVDFIRFEGQSLLKRPFDTAIEYFEELLQNEAEENKENNWYSDQQKWLPTEKYQDWLDTGTTIDDAFIAFMSNDYYNPAAHDNSLAPEIDYFRRYLKEYTQINKVSDINENHIAEFFSIWLVREFILLDTKQISNIFRATARFITFLFHHYNLNLKKEFLKYYEKLKLDLPRVIQATNLFISEYNLLDAVLVDEQPDVEQQMGFYKIIQIYDRLNRIIEVKNIHYGENDFLLKIASSAFFKLREGDVLHASLIKKSTDWEVLEIQYIYPSFAIRYI